MSLSEELEAPPILIVSKILFQSDIIVVKVHINMNNIYDTKLINNIEHNNILVEKSQNMYTFVSCNGQDDT